MVGKNSNSIVIDFCSKMMFLAPKTKNLAQCVTIELTKKTKLKRQRTYFAQVAQQSATILG